MQSFIRFLKTTLIGGAVIVLPLWLLAVVLGQVLGQMHDTLAPLAAAFPNSPIPVGVLVLAILVGSCFAAGLLVRTAAGERLRDRLDRRLVERVPSYRTVRGFVMGIAESGADGFHPVLFDSGGGFVLAILVERGGGFCTLFVPSTPGGTSGAVQIVPEARVHAIDGSIRSVMTVVSNYGIGARALLPAAHSAGTAA
jgi:uncharacterized membrane protein